MITEHDSTVSVY